MPRWQHLLTCWPVGSCMVTGRLTGRCSAEVVPSLVFSMGPGMKPDCCTGMPKAICRQAAKLNTVQLGGHSQLILPSPCHGVSDC
jgi:hypothetical protein